MTDEWQNRIDSVWAAAETLADEKMVARIDALAAGLPEEQEGQAIAAAAFLGLALASASRPVEGLSEVLRGLAPTLPRYRRSVLAYADELEKRVGEA